MIDKLTNRPRRTTERSKECFPRNVFSPAGGGGKHGSLTLVGAGRRLKGVSGLSAACLAAVVLIGGRLLLVFLVLAHFGTSLLRRAYLGNTAQIDARTLLAYYSVILHRNSLTCASKPASSAPKIIRNLIRFGRRVFPELEFVQPRQKRREYLLYFRVF